MKPTHKINIRGSQAKRCADDASCETAQDFRAFADREAKRESMVVELYLCTGPGTGMGYDAPFYTAKPDEATT